MRTAEAVAAGTGKGFDLEIALTIKLVFNLKIDQVDLQENESSGSYCHSTQDTNISPVLMTNTLHARCY